MSKDQFEQFWALYPKGYREDGKGSVQGSKKRAAARWRGLTNQEQGQAMRAVTHLKKHKYLTQAEGWLNQGLFETVLENESVKVTPKKQEQSWREKKIVEYSENQWFMGASKEELEPWMGQNPHLVWLVKELRPEIGKE